MNFYFQKLSLDLSMIHLLILLRVSTVYIFDFYAVMFCSMKLHLTRDEMWKYALGIDP